MNINIFFINELSLELPSRVSKNEYQKRYDVAKHFFEAQEISGKIKGVVKITWKVCWGEW